MWTNFKNQDKGVTAIEFSFAAPILFLFIIGALEVGHLMYSNAVLEGAAREAARRGITGFAPCGITREEYINQVIDQQLIGLADPDRRTVSTKVYKSFNDIGQPEPFIDANNDGAYNMGEEFTDENGNLQWDPDKGAVGLGSAGDVVVYDITYAVPILTGFFQKKIGLAESISISARAAVRNEPIPVDPNGVITVPCDL
ncbi:MAG: pilus assembly protein [Sphingomonadales bacterium]|jgi:Flp pilus assembly protein TadG